MNERKWLKKEGAKWIEKDVIQEEQLNQIVSLYEKKRNNLLPIFASLLIGLGVLTFIASNWGEMSDGFRFTLICAALLGFHLTGMTLIQKGNEPLGIAWIGIGTLTFGAGIFLTAQMFHIVTYHSSTFIAWTVIALITYLIIPNKYFYYLTLAIATAGLVYSSMSYQSFSPLLAAVLIIGVGYLTFKEDDSLAYYLYLVALTITGITFLIGYDLTYIWMTLVFLAMYGAHEVLRGDDVRHAFKQVSLIGSVAVCYIHVFFLEDFMRYEEEIIPAAIPYFGFLIALFAGVVWMKYKKEAEAGWVDLILFVPLYVIGASAGVFYLILVFGYSLFILIQGYHSEEADRINRGTILFLLSTLVAYVQLAWDFLPKSMFFLAGGIMLFVLSWYLERRRRKWLSDARGGQS